MSAVKAFGSTYTCACAFAYVFVAESLCVFAVGRIAFGCIHVRCVCWPLIND